MGPLVIVAGAGLVAGTMNALAGGGSFVTLPALMSAGVPAVHANASSTVALFPGGLASAWAYRDGLGPVGGAPLRRLLVVTLVGGVIGAVLLLCTPGALFERALPWLLLLATLAMAFGPAVGERLRRGRPSSSGVVLSLQLALGIYGGYFGGAVGIMMIAAWGLLDRRDVKSLHAPRTLLVSAANIVAVVVFACAHAVAWRETSVMLVTAIAGGALGAYLGRRASPRILRLGTLTLTVCITATFFARAYLPS